MPQDEAAQFHFRRLQKRFAERVNCRYVDISDSEFRKYPVIGKRLQSGQVQLPVILANHKVLFHGRFTSVALLKEVAELLSI